MLIVVVDELIRTEYLVNTDDQSEAIEYYNDGNCKKIDVVPVLLNSKIKVRKMNAKDQNEKLVTKAIGAFDVDVQEAPKKTRKRAKKAYSQKAENNIAADQLFEELKNA